MLMLMMKGLLLLNVDKMITLFCTFACQKGGQKGSENYQNRSKKEVNKGQKSYHVDLRSRMGQNAGRIGSKILPKRRSYPKWVKKERQKGSKIYGVVNVNGKPLTLTSCC